MSDMVSVIMPAFNIERYIAPALRSLLRETEVDLDIIVIDDGSTDRTAEVAEALAADAPSIRVVKGEHRGVAAARNRGLAEMLPASRYVAFLDADDHNARGRLRRQIGLLETLGGGGFVIGQATFFEEIDEATSEIVPGSRTITIPGSMLGACLFDRSAFDTSGPFDEELAAAEDIDLFLRLLERHAPCAAEDQVALLYRRHGSNMTNDVLFVRRCFADALRRSLVRRRQAGGSMAIGGLFQRRSAAEEAFRNG